MARRQESGLELLISVPWYIAVAIAVIVWVSAPYAAGVFASTSPLLAKSHQSVVGVLRLLAYVCLGAAAISWIRSLVVARKFAAQRSLADLRALTWQQFETIVGEAFRRTGYTVLETGQGGADGGVDLVLSKGGQRYLVQCKQYRASTVGVTTVREIYGVVAAQRAAGAIVVTTGSFTKDAMTFAVNQPIELIDGAKLEAMVRLINGAPASSSASSTWRSRKSSSSPSMSRSTSSSRSPSGHPSPASLTALSPPACPNCSAPMATRTAKAWGNSFWGCSTFPKCRGVRPVT